MNRLPAGGLRSIFGSAIIVTALGAATAGQPAKVKGVKNTVNNLTVDETPMQKSAAATSVTCQRQPAQPINGLASNPDEGGQVTQSNARSGKVTFKPFSITRKVDRSSPVFFDRSGHGCH